MHLRRREGSFLARRDGAFMPFRKERALQDKTLDNFFYVRYNIQGVKQFYFTAGGGAAWIG